MSHFVVLVIGEDIDKALAPFDEGIEVPEYSKGLVSKDDLKSCLEYYQRNHPRLGETTFDEIYAEFGESWNSNQWQKNANGEWEEFSTYNPKSKWDWYVVGGRWSEMLLLKQGNEHFLSLMNSLGMSIGEVSNLARLKNNNLAKYHDTITKYKGKEEEVRVLVSLANTLEVGKDRFADSAPKKAIDFNGMRERNKVKALAHYDLVASCFKGRTIPIVEKTFVECMEECDRNRDVALELYNAQPAVNELEEVKANDRLTQEQKDSISGFFFTLDNYTCGREAYGESAFKKGLLAHAILYKKKWYERGEMGWFAYVKDAKADQDWHDEVEAILNDVGDDEMITVVDCHI